MARYSFFQVDAFTTVPLGGNPCAVIFDTDDLNDETMLAIARENNLSETAFVRKSAVADFGVRYFTPSEEIPLAGHPTIATTWALFESNRIPPDRTTIHLELKVGPIRVDLETDGNGKRRIVMTQLKPKFLRKYEAEEVLPAFGLKSEDALPGATIQTVSTGTPQIMIPLRNQNALRNASVEIQRYTELRKSGDFFSPHLFCLGGFTLNGDTSARHFGLPPDTMEDPFTGSATGGMAAYLWHYRLIQSHKFIAEQGHWMNRPGSAYVEVMGPPHNIESVKIGGNAITVIRGELEI